jgi:hypothetical protein
MNEEFFEKLKKSNKHFIPLIYQIGQIISSKETQEKFVILDYKQISKKNIQ